MAAHLAVFDPHTSRLAEVGGDLRLAPDGSRTVPQFRTCSLAELARVLGCGQDLRPSEALVVSSSGGVKNAVVFIGHERLEG
jgi:hypothetical protein